MTDAPAIPYDGHADLDRAAGELAARLPGALAPLAALAYNYRWSWLPGGHELFGALDPARFIACGQNPVRLLQELPASDLEAAAQDAALVARAQELLAAVQADVARPTAAGPSDPQRPIAFLCAEYGVHVSLPVYSGGLGALAGDLLKEASDRAVGLVAVGLLYHKGYFRQRIDASGWQHEYWVDTDPARLPAALVTGPDGDPVTIAVPIADRDVTAQIWRVAIGRVPLFLLDTAREENEPMERWITGRLYDGDPHTRLAQYAMLGVGGIRALRALGYEPSVVHLNEGHAALAPLELARQTSANGTPGGDAPPATARTEPASVEGLAATSDAWLAPALHRARARTVFTTHTPVPAGNDSYPPAHIEATVGRLAGELGCSIDALVSLGQDHATEPAAPFGVTQAALRMSRAANAVSRRHGEVAREMWQGLWPGRTVDEVPIGYVTNGVHVPTWIGAPLRTLLDRHLPAGWIDAVDDPATWAAVDEIPAEELWAARQRQRADLIDFIRARSVGDRLVRGDTREYVYAAASAFDPDALTIGFARRVATYKRLDLLTRDPEWTLSVLAGDRPVQVVLAGKAHPRDDDAKHALQAVFGLKCAKVIGERVVFLDDYDLYSGACLVRGCDVWLNLPRPPLEASGTSGMKSVYNGGLQLSVLDGWWAEAYDGTNGWAISGEIDLDHHAQDARDAESLHRIISDEVLPSFYERDADGRPAAWIAMMRASLRTLGPMFSASRMLGEYVSGPYAG